MSAHLPVSETAACAVSAQRSTHFHANLLPAGTYLDSPTASLLRPLVADQAHGCSFELPAINPAHSRRRWGCGRLDSMCGLSK